MDPGYIFICSCVVTQQQKWWQFLKHVAKKTVDTVLYVCVTLFLSHILYYQASGFGSWWG